MFPPLSVLYIHGLALLWGVYSGVQLLRLSTIRTWEVLVLHFLAFSFVYAFSFLLGLNLFWLFVVEIMSILIAAVIRPRQLRYGTLGKGEYLRAFHVGRRKAKLVETEADFDDIDVLVIRDRRGDQPTPIIENQDELVKAAIRSGLDVRYASDMLQEMHGYLEVHRSIEAGKVDLRQMRSFDRLKSIVDKTLAFILIAILLPIIIVIYIIVLLVDGKPVIFKQARLGKRGRDFDILKFRTYTMPQHGEVPALTRLGPFLRASHLDELPQLFNILRGEMSFIGPRPEWQMLSTVENAPADYWARTAVKPGLSGWAQVCYKPSTTKHMRMRKLGYDLYYINHRSFFLDALIYLRTVAALPRVLMVMFTRLRPKNLFR